MQEKTSTKFQKIINMKPQEKKEYTLNRLKEAYQSAHTKYIEQAYMGLKTKYEETPLEKWESVPNERIGEYDHLRSLLIRAEQIEKQNDLKKITQSKKIVTELERHQYAPELNTLRIKWKQVNPKQAQRVKAYKVPQATTIGEALNSLTGSEIKNLCLYV
jgi:hypothetical protein